MREQNMETYVNNLFFKFFMCECNVIDLQKVFECMRLHNDHFNPSKCTSKWRQENS